VVGWNRRRSSGQLAAAAGFGNGTRTVSRTGQARDRRIAALRRWIVDAVDRAR
jgi:hypothetical protein